ncbi:MAG: DUF3352 domain-containing protein [Patescibacteria group bacterium]
MIKKIQLKKWLIGAAIVPAIMAFGWLGFYCWQNFGVKLPLAQTAQGLQLEELLPPTVSMVVSFNPSDEAERARFMKLWGIILQDKKDAVIPFLATQLAMGATGLNIENQKVELIASVLGAIGNDPRAIFATSPTDNLPEALIMLSLKDPVAFRAALKSMIGKAELENRVSVDSEKEFLASYEGGSSLYFGMVGDIFFVSQKKEAVDGIFSRYKKGGASFARNSVFKKAISKAVAPFSGYMFISMKNLPITGAFLSMHSQDSGLRLDSVSFGDKKSNNELVSVIEPFSATIHNKISGKNLIAYVSGKNLGNLLMGEIEALYSKEEKEKVLQQFKENTGFDYKKDIEPFVGGEYAFAFHNSGNIIPGFSFFVDANGSPEKATAVLQKIDAVMPGLVVIGNMGLQGNEKQPIIEYSKLASAKNGGVVKLYPDRVAKFIANIPLFQNITTPIEISFGMTTENLMFVSVTPKAEEKLTNKDTVADNRVFKVGVGLGVTPGSVFILDGTALGSYLQELVDLAKKTQKFSQDEDMVFALVKKHLSPIKSIAQIAQGNGEDIYGKARIEISQ